MLLPLILDLLISLPLLGLLWTNTLEVPILGVLGRGFPRIMLLFMPDVSWMALICGGLALARMALRAGLVIRMLRKPSSSGGAWGMIRRAGVSSQRLGSSQGTPSER